MPKFSKDSICQRFQYSKEDFELIVGLLKSNNHDVCKTFHCVWEDPSFEDLPREAASQVLGLVDNINRVGRDKGFDGLWDLVCKSEVCETKLT